VVYPRAPAARQPFFQQRQAAMPQRPSSGVTSQRPARVQNAAVRPNAPVRTQIAPQFLPQIVSYQTTQKPGTIVIGWTLSAVCRNNSNCGIIRPPCRLRSHLDASES
jgi:lipoprotein-anchoring transpeptidase ErfK/SrfK